MTYSPFHMLASSLATCTFSVIYSWATHAKLSVDDLASTCAGSSARSRIASAISTSRSTGPPCPQNRVAAARRVAELCTVHATLHHPPHVTIEPAAQAGARGAAGARRMTTATVPVVRFTVAGQEGATPSLGRAYTVVYDGDCKVCTRLSKVLRKWDTRRQLEVVSSQQPGVHGALPVDPRARLRRGGAAHRRGRHHVAGRRRDRAAAATCCRRDA